jgi:hypothetical protein
LGNRKEWKLISYLAGGLMFEITHFHFVDKFVVDIEKRSFSCNFWDLVGIP